MLAIDDIVTVHPSTRVDVATEYDRLGISSRQARVFSRLMSLGEVPVAGPGEEFALLTRALDGLLASSGVDPGRVGVVVHTHTGPYCGPVGQSLPRRLAARLGPQVLGFGMQLHKCVGSFTALEVIDRLLAVSEPGAAAVLLIGEVADSKDLRVLPTGLAGDLACAVLLTRTGSGDRVLTSSVRIHGQYAAGVYSEPGTDAFIQYERRFQDHLQGIIAETLAAGGVTAGDLRYILPHNLNIHVWQEAAGILGIDPDRLYLDNVSRYAHCFGADAFVNLASVRPSLAPGDHCLLVSAGVGGVFGAVLVQH
jgi:3-oxoacyl-[acyl-carrier-protein] synthase III